ncbi:hypothetical protein [Chitinophaga sp. MM2321]|uniref:hypothetical protein n=1 Tax=Chitinophaga sp. MM2321 TaxID=3137178 RepID=UPI0032D5965C
MYRIFRSGSLLLLLYFCAWLPAMSQSHNNADTAKSVIIPDTLSRHGFYNINEVGVTISDDAGVLAKFILGYRFAYKWQVGLGIGLDAYRLRSAPLFTDLRYDFSTKKTTFFLYGGAGVAIPWLTEKQWSQPYRGKPDRTDAGLYSQAGVGYKFRWDNRNSIHVAVGFSHTAMKQQYSLSFYEPAGPPKLDYEVYDYKFTRLNISFGLTL